MRPQVEVLAQEQVPGGNVDHAGDRTASLTGDVEEPVLAGRLAEGGLRAVLIARGFAAPCPGLTVWPVDVHAV